MEEESSDTGWKPWVYASYLLSLGVFTFVMGWISVEISRIDTRVGTVETQLDDKLSKVVDHSREDRREMMEALEKTRDKLDEVRTLLLGKTSS